MGFRMPGGLRQDQAVPRKSPESMGGMLGQRDSAGKKEQAIYYLSKKFTECEARYSALEQTCCALVWAAKRLSPYNLASSQK
ncbi:hypothetical protein CR513_47630, partial [Mucuna pruriens]